MPEGMGQALAVDWNEVRIMALAVGVRESARQLGLSEDAVRQRCYRERWLNKAREEEEKLEEARGVLRAKQGLSPVVTTAAEALSRTGVNTRAKLAVAVDKQAERLAETDADELLLMAQTVKTVVDSAAKLHGFDTAQVALRLDVIAAGSDLPVIDV